jgi:hypothetical protein
MNHIDVTKYMTSAIAPRREILNLSLDRGLGRPTQIEDWIITEMLAKLIELRDRHVLQQVEGEHRYPTVKNPGAKRRSFERCDLWWTFNGEEHWLEVKTVYMPDQQQCLSEIAKDLRKRERLSPRDKPHHLAIVFPVPVAAKQHWINELTNLYGVSAWKLDDQWDYPVWEKDLLSMFLFSPRS